MVIENPNINFVFQNFTKGLGSELKCGKKNSLSLFFFLKFENLISKKREYATEIFSFMEFFGNFSQRKKRRLVSILESITSIGEPKKDYWL